ncbi:MAG: hypothetical protein ACP5NZ_00690 [Nanobdellota archaeon]
MKVKKGVSKKFKILIIAFVIVVLLVAGYFGYKAYKSARNERDFKLLEQGFNYGYTSAVIQIMNVSDSCQPFPVYVGNESRVLISVNCLNKT